MITSQYFNITSNASVFASNRHIANKQHCSIWVKSLSNVWTQIPYNDYDLVNNSIILNDTLLSTIYSQVELRVADSQEELGTPVTDISTTASIRDEVIIVADNISDITTVSNNIVDLNSIADNIVKAGVVADNIADVNLLADNMTGINIVASNSANINIAASNIDEIQNASTNASIATTKALEASNSATSAYNSSVSANNSSANASNSEIKANKWADNNYNVEVETGKYSAKHWAIVSQNSIGVKVVENISSLKTFNINEANQIEVLGYYTKGDGGGGLFYWDNTSIESDNGGTIIQATGVATGRWKRVFSGAINVKWFGAKGDGVTDDGPTIRDVYENFRFIRWSAGEYRLAFFGVDTLEQFVRVYANTTTIFDSGTVILRDPSSSTSGIFCNTDRDDTSTTGYNGDGNIHFFGDPEFAIYGDAVANMEPFAFVHARNITVIGKGVIRGWTGRHAIEFNACADWKVCGYKFKDQETPVGNESLSECIQWDGAFQDGSFPFGQGAVDNTPCDNFEISDCEFDNVYTAYGAHHTDFGGVKHTRPNIRNNKITNAKSEGERLRHLKGGSATGQIINKTIGRATNPRDCIGLYQDGYTITDGGNSGTSVVFFQTSQDCVWGPNSVIKYSGDGTRHAQVFETGSSSLPSSNILIHEGICDAGSSVTYPIMWDASGGLTGNKLIGGKAASNNTPVSTLGRFFQSLIIPAVSANNYLLLAKVSDASHGVFGRFYARRTSTSGSGSQFNVVEVSSAAGTDGSRRTTWSQSVENNSNLITLVTVVYQGYNWLAIKAPATITRAFANDFVFSGFFTDMPGQFTVAAASSVSGEVALPASTGIIHFSGGLRVDGSSVIFANLPTSASGLSSGAIWRNGVSLSIVP